MSVRSGCEATLLPLYGHLLQSQNVRMAQHLQQLHFSQCSDRKALFLIMHDDLLQCYKVLWWSFGLRLRHHTERALTQLLLRDDIVGELCTPTKASLSRICHGLAAGRCCDLRHVAQLALGQDIK